MSKRRWFEKYGKTSDGKRWTYKEISKIGIKHIPASERWNFSFMDVVINDNPNWNYKLMLN